MTPERIEQLARLAYEAAQDYELGAVPAWHDLPNSERAPWYRPARALYAEAMKDAAGVADRQVVKLKLRREPVEAIDVASYIGHELHSRAKDVTDDQ